MMKYFKLGFLYLCTSSWDIVAWLCVFVLWLFFGTGLTGKDRCLMAEFKPKSWPIRTWYKKWSGTTFGHAVMFRPGGNRRNTRLYKHELAHVEQYEGAMVLGVINGVCITIASGNYILGLVVWTLHGALFVIGNSFVAWLRGELIYRGSSHEEGARGIAETKRIQKPHRAS